MTHRWTEEELRFLAESIPGRSRREVYEMFCRRFDWEPTFDQLVGTLKNHKLYSGRDTRYKKGNPSHNKGRKMPEHVYERASATMFRPGHTPHNTVPIGTEAVTGDGYIVVKISDDKKPSRFNWVFKHRLIYESIHGEIPKGHVVTFLDGDKQNLDPDNLICVNRKVNMTANRLGLLSTDPDVTRLGLRLAELKHRRSERQKT